MKNIREYLGKQVEVFVDRPLGSKHPKHNIYYPVNYGYIPDTISGDGEPIDAYVLGEFNPIDKYIGIVIGIIVRKDDNEDKLVVAESISKYSKEQIRSLTEFQEKYFKSEIFCFDHLKQSIRATSKAIIRKDESIFLIEEKNVDPSKSYYRLPGGGIEFQELSRDAIVREILEELNVTIIELKYLTVIENLIEFNGIKAHEICFLYEIIVSDNFYNKEIIEITEETSKANAFWINYKSIINNEIKVYPEGIRDLL